MSEKEMRVNGVVATTRGLGNHGDVALKKSVIVEPHTMSVAVDQYCQFLLLASRGVWEVFTETEATNLLLKVTYVCCLQSLTTCIYKTPLHVFKKVPLSVTYVFSFKAPFS